MEGTENIDISDFCFRIIFDYNSVDVDKFFNILSKVGDVIFFNDSLYVWLYKKENKSVILKNVKKVSQNYHNSKMLIIPLIYADIRGKNDFLEAFVNEHLTKLMIDKLNAENQEELRKMCENIVKANEILEKKIKEAKNA